MSFARLWTFLAVALPVLGSLLANLPATDLAYQLRAGAEILDTGRIPATDSWTFTAFGAPWVDQQWGSQVLFSLTYQATGWAGLIVLRAVLVGVAFAAVLAACVLAGAGTRSASWITLGAFVIALPGLAMRPQLLGVVLFAILLLIVAARRDHPRVLWLIPVVALVWANLHGSFFLVPAVLGLTWLADRLDGHNLAPRTLAAGVLGLLATFVTPFGPAVWSYALGLGSNAEVATRITEWQPTSLRDFAGFAFFGSLLVVIAAIARYGRPVSWSTLAWLGFFFALGVYASRGVAWWALAAAAVMPALVGAVSGDEPQTPRAIRRANAVLVAVLALAGLALLPFWRGTDPALGAPAGVLTRAPSDISRELRDVTKPGDRLFNPQPLGSWFEFAFPDVLVAIDSRIELFPREVWEDYLTAANGQPGWDSVLDRWAVTIVVTEDPEADLAHLLVEDGWSVHYASETGAILVRGANR